MSTPAQLGLQMSDTVPGPFCLFRCAELKPSALRSQITLPSHWLLAVARPSGTVASGMHVVMGRERVGDRFKKQTKPGVLGKSGLRYLCL